MPPSNLNLVLRAFQKGGRIPVAFTEDGGDTSPEMEWSGAPAGTRAFALVVDDPDAPVGTWVHWVLYDLPAAVTKLGENQPRGAAAGILANGAKQGKNSWGRLGWNGPAPPRGKPHRYFFRLYALSAPTGLAPGADRADLDRAMKGKLLGEAEWMGTYGR
ncbi:MAG: YbhB/YbcL family Raf kinase inhibitor-like protein [Acidobacteriota bacterium]|nr:YbhB/YbcL family Raf kinase inhibitor-like protein [Acidobacteriota bacterium]